MTAGRLRGSGLIFAVLLLSLLALGMAGCGDEEGTTATEGAESSSSEAGSDDTSNGATPEGDDGSEGSSDEVDDEPAPDPAASPDVAVWIEGTWTIESTLTAVDPEWMRPAADQPLSRWYCTADGTSMTIETGRDSYKGTLTVDVDAWAFEGDSSYVDGNGIAWSSSLSVAGTRDGEDAFTAVTSGEVSNDTGGRYYGATWDQVGTRER